VIGEARENPTAGIGEMDVLTRTGHPEIGVLSDVDAQATQPLDPTFGLTLHAICRMHQRYTESGCTVEAING